ncbi:MAG: hypothetical protein J6Y02_19040 [Pseudobutyrivibrio sp.]|nr:hypothetical protein [Pseudobutyrivibrio sp.]
MGTYGYLVHHGILGQKWGVRRYQNPDGSLTEEGRKRYGYGSYRKENSPYQTYQDLKNLHEGEKSGNIKNVFNNYFNDEPTAHKIKNYTKQIVEDIKSYRDEWDRIVFKTNDLNKGGEFESQVIKNAAKTIDEETHPDGVYSTSKYIYLDDLYDYLVDEYANLLSKKYPKLKELEQRLKKNTSERTAIMQPFIEDIVGDIGSKPVYSQQSMFGTISPHFRYVVRDILLSDQDNGLYWNDIKSTVDMDELVTDDLSKLVKELENEYKIKVID